MWKGLWQKWTIDEPAALGDWLWHVFVVQLAAFLDRLTLRRIIALIPVVLFFLAYAHRIPVPPESMLVGDFVAYIDVFSALLVLGLLSRAATIFFIVKGRRDLPSDSQVASWSGCNEWISDTVAKAA
jgi:hypothetical protein